MVEIRIKLFIMQKQKLIDLFLPEATAASSIRVYTFWLQIVLLKLFSLILLPRNINIFVGNPEGRPNYILVCVCDSNFFLQRITNIFCTVIRIAKDFSICSCSGNSYSKQNVCCSCFQYIVSGTSKVILWWFLLFWKFSWCLSPVT